MSSSAFAASRTYDLPPFEAVSVDMGITAIIEVGGAQSVRAEAASDAALERLDIHVTGNRLHVTLNWNFFSWLMELGRPAPAVVNVTVPKLVAASASSGANVDVRHAAGDALSIDASSGASLAATMELTGGAALNASSGAHIVASGTCLHLVVTVSSGAGIDAGQLVCRDATGDASSGGRASVSASQSIVANASSGGKLQLTKRPPSVTVSTSSGGSVSFGD